MILASGIGSVYNEGQKPKRGIAMGREFELKYQAEAGDLEKIREKFGDFREISMETTYYDTPLLALRARHWTLRRRLENGVSVCTVKTPLPDGSRGEWEVEAPDISVGLPKLIAMGAPGELAELVKAGVAPFCGARFTRLAKLLPTEDGTVELALDQGVLLGGNRELRFAEVEVELKSGSDRGAEAFAQALAAEFGLSIQPKSKLARAMALA